MNSLNKSLSYEQAEAVLTAAEADDSTIGDYTVVSLLGGLRTEEARPLAWVHVHLPDDVERANDDAELPHVDVFRSDTPWIAFGRSQRSYCNCRCFGVSRDQLLVATTLQPVVRRTEASAERPYSPAGWTSFHPVDPGFARPCQVRGLMCRRRDDGLGVPVDAVRAPIEVDRMAGFSSSRTARPTFVLSHPGDLPALARPAR